MSIHKISDYSYETPEDGFVPLQDGPVMPIIWDTNAPGARRITVADGTGTIKYLLEITAANYTTNGVARTLKLYTLNVQSGALTYLYTLPNLGNAGLIYNDHNEAFWVNIAGGYFCFEYNRNLWVFGLEDGALWGSSGFIVSKVSLTLDIAEPVMTTVLPHPTNPNIFNFIYGAGHTAIRQVTVDPINKTVDWGTQTVYPADDFSYSGRVIPDTRPNGFPGWWVVGRASIVDFYEHLRPLTLNPATGVMTTSPYLVSVGGMGLSGGIFFMGDDIINRDSDLNNMKFRKSNPWASTAYTTLNWGASGSYYTHGLMPYFDFDGTFGKYMVYYDSNQDVWITKDDFNSITTGSFGSVVFRANSIVPGMMLTSKSIVPCKNGFFYCGYMNTTTTTAPLIWYQLKPNLP